MFSFFFSSYFFVIERLNKRTQMWLQSVPTCFYDGSICFSLFRLIVIFYIKPSTDVVFAGNPAGLFTRDGIQKVIFNVCIVTVANSQPCSIVLEKLQVSYAVAWHWLLSQSSNYLKAACARNVSKKLYLKSALWPRKAKNGNKFEESQGERK